MRAVLISIRPKWCEKIINGDKTIEVRKTRPKLETPFKCYIYCTKDKHLAFMQNRFGTKLIACMDAETAIPVGGAVGNGKIIGEFTCDRIDWITHIGYTGIPNLVETCICDVATMRTSPVGGLLNAACLTPKMLNDYLAWGDGYGWHITDLEIYDQPKELNEFWFPPELYCEKERCGSCPCDQAADVNGEYSFDCEWKRPLTRAPQSWCYMEDVHDEHC